MTFRALPYSGGLWEQPAELVDGMRVVSKVVNAVRKAEHDRELARAKAVTGGN
jgi:hypothetical protein